MLVEDEGKTKDLIGSYYQDVCNNDIIEKFRPLLATGGYRLRDEDGKICVTIPSMEFDGPWHHIVHDTFLDCQRWHSILFNFFSRTLPQDRVFIPSACHQCWKVVVRPKTLLGLFSLMNLMMKLQRPSKCGVETRPYVHGLYGGYFYNHSLKQGVECYKVVRNEVNDALHLGKDTSVILKRACTEYEKKLGDSTKWAISNEQIHIETLINKWFVKDNVSRQQPEHLVARVHRKWIEWAYANGDPTYIEFTGGKPIYEPVVTYHHIADLPEDEAIEIISSYDRKCHFGYDL